MVSKKKKRKENNRVWLTAEFVTPNHQYFVSLDELSLLAFNQESVVGWQNAE